jgi:HSP20 family protein
MAPGQELEVQKKRELTKKNEATIPARIFLPNTDIYETDEALIVAMEMAGVEKDHTDINVEDGVLSVSGRIDFSKYEELQPIYTEYNIGYYQRSFSLSPSSIDEHKITAEMKDGVLTLTLPKAERVKPRMIHVK